MGVVFFGNQQTSVARSASMSMMIVAKLFLLGLLLSKSYSQHISLCTGVDDNCQINENFCSFLTPCTPDCQTIDTVAYACPDKCRKCSGSGVCNDSKPWCNFLNPSKAVCAKYDIGIKICPQACGKCNDCKFIRRNNGCSLVNGNWGHWNSWSACDGNQQTRTRSCNNPSPSGTCAKNCLGSSVQSRTCGSTSCFLVPCPAHCRCVKGVCVENSETWSNWEISGIGRLSRRSIGAACLTYAPGK